MTRCDRELFNLAADSVASCAGDEVGIERIAGPSGIGWDRDASASGGGEIDILEDVLRRDGLDQDLLRGHGLRIEIVRVLDGVAVATEGGEYSVVIFEPFGEYRMLRIE